MAEYKGAASEAGRVRQLIKRRELQKEQLEKMKQKIEQDNVAAIQHIGAKFSSHYDAVEQQLKSSTIGLVTLDQMKAKREDLIKEREQKLARLAKEDKESRKSKKKKRKQKSSVLSFEFQDDEEEGEEEHDDDKEVKIDEETPEDSNEKEKGVKKRRIGKNPDVDTSFLPDRDREEEENKQREQLRKEWIAKQETLKAQEIEITYSYWDGSGHRRSVKMKKGDTMQRFLMKCLESLRRDFHELKAVTVEQMMYIKEDLIIPHHYSFYDFIVTKARGKSGPLFNFDVHDDIRLVQDATKEKDESHAGKVVLRNWYERNKHIFPASRWEPYDPEKKWDKYTIK
ncbi:FAM50-like protein [Apostichopus japonicus]|uniref:FAM50-like protein n=1 Tax=Stichopus japonicus TaxID=307972 RepID=A0A2G8K3B7_STIJA|nr:FAM50-like protein [Apostichopus japonicus]